MNNLKYRAEIDGLRALAVIPVILFHAQFVGFSGGYIGVDIFFVISGYLITTIIINDMEKGSFSLLYFYERRARRILPALFFIVLTCLPFAWAYLSPQNMKDFAESVVGVASFSSNFLFWKESGYFGTAIELKPLLHTWSLAVEEQYYIFFPLFLMLMWRFGLRPICIMLALVFLVSLGLAQMMLSRDPGAAFFLLPFRGWEILLGAFCAFYLHRYNPAQNAMFRQGLSLLGLALIILSIFIFTPATQVPGYPALVPTIGAALIILYARQGTIVCWLLSQRPFVFIGLVSYSAYLWHQPVFAFARHATQEMDLSWEVYSALIISSLMLAGLSWKFIETPFRDRHKITRRHLTIILLPIFLLIFLAGIAGHITNGFKALMMEYKYDQKAQIRVAAITEAIDYDMYNQMYTDGECLIWERDSKNLEPSKLNTCHKKFGKALVVLGDSHAMNVYNIFAKSGIYPFILGLSQGGCRPQDNKSTCHYDHFEIFLEQNPDLVGGIVYHQSGSYFTHDKDGRPDSHKSFEGEFGEYDIKAIDATIKYLQFLQSLSAANIFWLGPYKEYRHNPDRAIEEEAFLQINPHSLTVFHEMETVINSRRAAVFFNAYKPFDVFFAVPDNGLQGRCFIFRDGDHFSRCGEDLLSTSEKLQEFDWSGFVRD